MGPKDGGHDGSTRGIISYRHSLIGGEGEQEDIS